MVIYVGNFPLDIPENDIRELFGSFGNVDRIQMISDPVTGTGLGFAFVEMPVEDEARAALDALRSASLGGRALMVRVSPERLDRRTALCEAEIGE